MGTTGAAQNAVARLISPVFVPQVHISRVLRFWFFKNVIGNSGFRVYLMLNGSLDPNPVWEETGRASEWRMAEINIDGRNQFQVVLEGFRSGGNLLDLAIDDVTILDPDQDECNSNPCMNNGVCSDALFSYTCACRPQWVGSHCSYGIGSCDFEEPLSNYNYLQDDTDDFDWTVVSVASRRPSTDHTIGTGSYAYIGSTGGSSGDKARLLSPSLSATAASCVQFWYYMSGAGVASLNVYTRQQQQQNVLVANITGDQGDQWRMKEVELVSNSDYVIVFEGIKGTGLNGDIAIDDISVTGGACTSPEFNNCRNNPCLNNGVCVDGLGQYACTCTSGWYGNRCESNSVVCANSPCQNGGSCNPGGGSFTCRCLPGWSGLYCQTETNECASNPCLHGQCIDVVNGYNCDCDLGWIGTNCNQDIDECASSPCQNGGVCTDQDNGYVCSCSAGFTGTNCDVMEITIAPQTPYRCDFDTNNCGFVQATDDDADFVRLTGKCGNYGAPADHTTGQNGFYMCLESTTAPNTMAAMYSPTFVTTYPRKLRFWFYKNTIGDSFMELTVKSTGQPNNVNVWTADDRSADWRMAELDLPAGRFELTFRGVKNGYRSTDFGFDDIQILDPNTNECASSPCQNGGTCTDGDFTFSCTCMPPYTGALCETDHDYCASQPCSNGGTCLDLQSGYSCICPVGYGGDDCTRYVLQDDVLYLCDLDNGLCGWEQLSSPDDTADFTVIQSGKCGISGPDGDRTTGAGSYVCMPTGTRNGRARLRSPVFTTTGNVGRTLSFWYYKDTPGDSTLRVYLMTDDNAPVGPHVWSATGRSDEWRRGTVDVNDTTQFRVIFEAYQDGFNPADIGLDDIAFLDPDVDDCLSNPCLNGGSCVDMVHAYMCRCLGGWTGINCDEIYGAIDFERELQFYGYIQSNDDDFDWTIESGNTASSLTGPDSDHTTGYGQYAHIEATCHTGGKKARLAGPIMPITSGTCLQFYYHMYGPSMGTLNVYTRHIGHALEQPVWSLSGDQGNAWKMAEVEIVDNRAYEIVFEGVTNGALGDAAIDDVTVYDGACQSGSEYDDCASNPCRNGGTCQDGVNSYTCQCPPGWFGIHCELDNAACGSYPCQNGGVCSGGNFDNYVCTCRRGWRGDDCDVDVDECSSSSSLYCQNGATCENIQGSYTCHCGAGWIGNNCETNVCTNNPCRNGGTCQVAQDAVQGFQCLCQPGFDGSTCSHNKHINGRNAFSIDSSWLCCLSLLVSLTHDRPIVCNLEVDDCGWENTVVTTDDLDWFRTQAGNCGSNGPPQDHTAGVTSGTFFCMVPPRGSFEDKIAQLWSPSYTSNTFTIKTFTFWYYSTNVDVLNVFLVVDEVIGTLLWSGSFARDTRAARWREVQVNVSASQDFRIAIEAHTRGRPTPIALDDITISDTGVPYTPARTTSAPSITTTTTTRSTPTMSPTDQSGPTYPTTTTPKQDGTDSGGSSPLVGIIVGVSVGALALIAIIIGIVFFIRRRSAADQERGGLREKEDIGLKEIGKTGTDYVAFDDGETGNGQAGIDNPLYIDHPLFSGLKRNTGDETDT
ncbi:fibropellin-1-like [Branchiostoma lanceolatum]|uniref:fibropellin-1-like n=1 Tax=Branchiostoma lanceolatum TaxID=7740 RepID=UPI0034548BAC